MAYITTGYTWSDGDTITATRLNSNVSAYVDALSGGTKDVNVLTLEVGGTSVLSKSGSDVNLANINTFSLSDNITLYKAENDGNPDIRIGATDAEEFHITTVFDSGAQTLDYVVFQTDVASATANKGKYIFNVDGTNIIHIDDGGIQLLAGKDLIGSSTSDITINTNKFTVAGSTGNTVVGGTLNVTGAITAPTSTDTINSVVINAGAVSGVTTLTMSSDLTINTDKFTVAGSTGNTVVGGTFDVTGAADFSGDVTMGVTGFLYDTSEKQFAIGTTDFASASGVAIAIANTSGAPSGTPTGGGVLYVESGALKYKGSSGTVTTIAVA